MQLQLLVKVLVIFFIYQISPIHGECNDSNILAHYLLDGSDKTVNATGITIVGGRYPGSKAFNFSQTRLFATAPAIKINKKNFTIACWVKPSFLKEKSAMFIYGDWLDPHYRFYLGINRGKLHFARHGFGNMEWWNIQAGLIPVKQWTHIAVTWNQNEGLAVLFVNATKVGNRSFNSGSIFKGPISRSYRIGFDGLEKRQFFGAIMDLYILDASLSGHELEHLGGNPYAEISQGNMSIMVGQKLKLDCVVNGGSILEVQWKKDGSSQIPRADVNNTTLEINSVILEDKGLYECHARNRIGVGCSRSWISIFNSIETENYNSTPLKWNIGWALLISFAVCVALVFAGCLLRRQCKQGRSSTGDPHEEPTMPSTQTGRNPSDPWEILEDDVYIKGFLGVGAFGEVWRAVLKQVAQIKENREVAVKKLRGNVNRDSRAKFMKEIELGKILGACCHPNITQFIGCVISTENLMIVMEYTPYGDLLGFMRRSRGVEDRHRVGEELHVRELNNYDLVTFAQQVACGMMFLNSKGIMHRDLAARNILITTDFVCKITDFGMAYESDKYGYEAASRGRMPIKWTAPEVLFESSSFPMTSKSDVWSYGVLLYEIFTLGGNPYDGLRAADVIARLQNNQYRMPKPEHVSDEIYAIMMRCWNEDPSDRPNFENLHGIFLGMIAEKHYMEVFNKAKYVNELYQPEKFVSGNDQPADSKFPENLNKVK